MAFLEDETGQQERFNLLLLEPGEIYFEDYSVYYYLPGLSEDETSRRKQRGHLKTCSKSIVFAPSENQYPILKFPMKNIDRIEEFTGGGLFSKIYIKDKTLQISSSVTVEMKKDNIISPYVFRKEKADHIFILNYVNTEDCVPQMCQLHRASTLASAEQTAMIGAIVLSRQSRVKFNTSWLEDLYETIQLDTQGNKITPLVTNPGRIMLTSCRLYFQPYNNVERAPVIKIKLKDIKQLTKRRFLLKQIGLEILCYDHCQTRHLYLSLKSQEDRDALYDKIMFQQDTQVEVSDQLDMTLKWQNGAVSNYEYLMYLNSCADRSFYDLTQYPVMPWVVQDLTSNSLDLENPETFRDLSKPIGALNQERLEILRERYREMPDPKFLYGAHYSTPGYVTFYLARIAPEYVLCLQNGKFDNPDRMFNSVYDLWQNCLQGAADFKELIPEFYEGDGDFMINNGISNFGIRQDGRPVSNVELPPWAKDSKDYVCKLREALESDYVSKHIHDWIDLMFGYKQRGEEAEKADNVFYYMTYEGAIDLDSIEDPNKRAAMEIQIMEFGQVPKQLFTKPHPQRYGPRHVPRTLSTASHDIKILKIPTRELPWRFRLWSLAKCQNNCSPNPTHRDMDLEMCPEQFPHIEDPNKRAAMEIQIMEFGQVPKQLFIKPHPQRYGPRDVPRTLSTVSHVSSDGLDYSASQNDPTKDNEQQQTKNIDFTSLQEKLQYCLHKDTVTDVKLGREGKCVFSVSQDSLLKMYSIEDQRQLRSITLTSMALSSCLVMEDNKTIICGSWDNNVYFYSIEYGRVLDTLQSHDDAVSAICWKKDILLSSSWDSTVKIWHFKVPTLQNGFQSAEYVTQLDHDSGICCMSVDEECSVLVTGTKDGIICVWDVIHYYLLSQHQIHLGNIFAVLLTQDKHQIISCGEDKYFRVTDLESGTEMFVKDMKDPIISMAMFGNTLLSGTGGGMLQVWDIEKANLIHETKAHNGKITCLSISDDCTVLTASADKSVKMWRPTLR